MPPKNGNSSWTIFMSRHHNVISFDNNSCQSVREREDPDLEPGKGNEIVLQFFAHNFS